MTAPVTQEPAASGWAVSFIMPAGRTMADLPEPAGDVRPVEANARLVAAVRFSGRWTDVRFDRFARQLDEWARTRGLAPVGPPEYAYYNGPFTPGFLRRNEVPLPVAELRRASWRYRRRQTLRRIGTTASAALPRRESALRPRMIKEM